MTMRIYISESTGADTLTSRLKCVVISLYIEINYSCQRVSMRYNPLMPYCNTSKARKTINIVA